MNSRTGSIWQRIASRLLPLVDQLAYSKFHNYPFGDSPRASADQYRELWNKAKSVNYPALEEFEEKCGFSVDQQWLHELALLTQVVKKKSSLCYQHGRVLYSSLSAYIQRGNYSSLNILETGTARGFSCLCMAKALADMGQAGKIVTLDVLPHDVEMFWNCIADENGPMSREDLLSSYESLLDDHIIFIQGDSRIQLRKMKMSRIHFAYLDGQHTYDYALSEFSFLKDRQRRGDIVVFDDYTTALFPGIVRAVDEICGKYGYSKEVISVSDQRGNVIAQKK